MHFAGMATTNSADIRQSAVSPTSLSSSFRCNVVCTTKDQFRIIEFTDLKTTVAKLGLLLRRVGGIPRPFLRASLGRRSSMTHTGVCWDNSMAESFFSLLKNECVYRTTCATKSHARSDVIRCVEPFTTADAGIPHWVIASLMTPIMVIHGQHWQCRRIHKFHCSKCPQQLIPKLTFDLHDRRGL